MLAAPKYNRLRLLLKDEGAAVYVEFITAFIPVFVLFLGAIQITFAFTAKLVVQHAANMAARSAAVVIPEDPALVGGVPNEINFVEKDLGESDLVMTLFDAFGGLLNLDEADLQIPIGDFKLWKIRLAAYKPLIPLSPDLNQFNQSDDTRSIETAIGRSGSRASQGLVYALMGIGVNFPSEPGEALEVEEEEEDEGDEEEDEEEGPPAGFGDYFGETVGDYVDHYGRDDDYEEEGDEEEDDGNVQSFEDIAADAPDRNGTTITVRVTYLYHCGVPAVRKLVCGSTLGTLEENQPEAAQELANTPLRPVLRRVLGFFAGSEPFTAIRADGTFAYQGAGYSYSGGDDEIDEELLEEE